MFFEIIFGTISIAIFSFIKQFYRFTKPADGTFPYMLELFSRKPDALSIADESHLTPIPTDQEVASLSAILLDDGYYSFITQGKKERD